MSPGSRDASNAMTISRCNPTESLAPTIDIASAPIPVPSARAAVRADSSWMVLIALREAVLAGAENAGQQDSPAKQRQLDEIDRFLFEARAMRLELDAEELRKVLRIGVRGSHDRARLGGASGACERGLAPPPKQAE